MSPTWGLPISSSCRFRASLRSLLGLPDNRALCAKCPLWRAEGFARFVNGCHKVGIGVILDWVPAHFPTDAHGLREFRWHGPLRTCRPAPGFPPDWNTAIYNFGRNEVLSYLINNALYWAEKFHLDGLRVDAVASMLYPRLFPQGRRVGSPLNMAGAKIWRPCASCKS